MDPDHQLLETLELNETLQHINIPFLEMYQRFKIDMVRITVKTNFGVTKDFVVNHTSAAPDLPGVTYYGIEATHSRMCRFDSKEAPVYRSVAMQVKRWAIEATPIIQDRLKVEKGAKRKAGEIQARGLMRED